MDAKAYRERVGPSARRQRGGLASECRQPAACPWCARYPRIAAARRAEQAKLRLRNKATGISLEKHDIETSETFNRGDNEMRFITAAAAALLLTMSGLAQAQNAPKLPSTPTAAQCTTGYKAGMPWTKQQFTAACVKVTAKSQGK
ncbi:MAG: hypothetical protein AB7O57_02620 [Hyphomicrobiaceae bacterium]